MAQGRRIVESCDKEWYGPTVNRTVRRSNSSNSPSPPLLFRYHRRSNGDSSHRFLCCLSSWTRPRSFRRMCRFRPRQHFCLLLHLELRSTICSHCVFNIPPRFWRPYYSQCSLLHTFRDFLIAFPNVAHQPRVTGSCLSQPRLPAGMVTVRPRFLFAEAEAAHANFLTWSRRHQRLHLIPFHRG
ncbi:hypothetical protein M413DRAFT_132904 [Hebeloma cylindrosporum]|uniref:Uncharacterized protein n=1 Tax=Hebeloma cylindrosporum TaxID=76867 RepID=A0A0C2XXI7_HEBCY|nr:hypothetical protein M413DRAFT_132904 [Hebeloma cylindrosporum h7]